MPKFFDKLVLLAKIEATRGTDAVPTGAANAILVSNVSLTPINATMAERNNIKPYFGNNKSTLVAEWNKITFDVEVAGSGAAGTAPKIDSLLRACAMGVTIAAGVSVTYAPVSSAMESNTFYCNIDGVNHVMLDARGTVKMTAQSKGYPKWSFDMTGLFVPLTDTPLPTPVYTGFVDPVGMNKANTVASLHGVTVACSEFIFDAANNVVKRDNTDVNAVEVTGRGSNGSMKFEAVPIATKDWIAAFRGSAIGAQSFVHGKTAGNIVEVASSKVQLGQPSYSEEDRVHHITVPTMYVPDGAGNNEFSFIFR